VEAAAVLRDDRLEIRNYIDVDLQDQMRRDVRSGLTRDQKTVPCKYLYDERGSRLFEQICATPEYYPTRTELGILDRCAGKIMSFFRGRGGNLVEMGSGANTKIRKLLDAMDEGDRAGVLYVPLDISPAALIEASRELLDLYDDLEVLGLVADFTRHLHLLPPGRKMIAFFGSSLGNFSPEAAAELLRGVAKAMNPGDRFLLGLDMVKSPAVIEAAYNDRQGVTRRFSRNLLSHLNRSLGADFDPIDFEHVAFYDQDNDWVEVHLQATRPVRVSIDDLSMTIEFEAGETIHTEICRKFSRQGADVTFARAGLRPLEWHTDPRGWFSLVTLARR
jgi:L-histidine N-alpha-methyltransferase